METDILVKLPTKKHEKTLCSEVIELLADLGLPVRSSTMLIQFGAELISAEKLLVPSEAPSQMLLNKLAKLFSSPDTNDDERANLLKVMEYYSKSKEVDLEEVVGIVLLRLPHFLHDPAGQDMTQMNSMLSILINISDLKLPNELTTDLIERLLLNPGPNDNTYFDSQMLVLGLLNNMVENDKNCIQHLSFLELCQSCTLIACLCNSKKSKVRNKSTKTRVGDKVTFPFFLVNKINSEFVTNDQQVDTNGQTLFSCILLINLIQNQPELVPKIKTALNGSSFDLVKEVLEDYLAFREMLNTKDGDKGVVVVQRLLQFIQNQ